MHSTTLVLATLLALFVGSYIFRIPVIKRHGEALKRSPNTLPLIGNGLLFLQARHKLFSWFVKCEKIFGFETFQISIPTLPGGVVVNDPQNLEYILKHEGMFAKGDFFKTRSFDLFGNGIINADGELWKVQRKAGLNFLNTANLKVLTDIALPQYLKENVLALSNLGNKTVVDLQDVFNELTTLLMGKMAYDMEMHDSDPFSKAFEVASAATGDRFQNPLWQVTEIFFGGRLRRACKVVKTFGDEIVAKAVADRKRCENLDSYPKSDGKDGIQAVSGSLIGSLLDAMEEQDKVADAALNYLTAGRDTTAQTLTWAFYLMMRHPGVIEKIRNEAESVLKEHSDSDSNSKDMDIAVFDAVSLPYAMAVFYETLRFYPPIPFELRECQEATTLPDGTFLPEKSVVLWCIWAMNRSWNLWGEDADVFKPERWLEDGRFKARTAFEFPVFNGGTRLCLGKKMAEVVVVQTIATFALSFDFKPSDDKERITANSLTLPMEGGLPVYVSSRSRQEA